MKQVNQYTGKEFNKKENVNTTSLVLPAGQTTEDIGTLTGIKIQHE